MDFLSAYSAVNQGHVHPKILKTFIEQAQKLTLTSRAVHSNLLGLAEKKLHDMFGYDKTLFMNSGVEAGESAVKFARRWGYVNKKVESDQATVLFAKGNFWGRTIAACGSSEDPERYHNFGPFKGLNFDLIDYGSI
jgi:ornithine--oxo-acid transaminase